MAEINRVAGGDPRSVRRAMARAKAKRNSLAIPVNADLC
jgi:2-oxoglutarate dehydrogenase complex dehydrogenase (E1) component-like enzyme